MYKYPHTKWDSAPESIFIHYLSFVQNDFPRLSSSVHVCTARKTCGNVFSRRASVCVCVSQEAADSLVEDFVITESAEAVEEAIAESTVLQVRGGTSLSAVATPHALLAPFLLWSPNSLQLPGGGGFSLFWAHSLQMFVAIGKSRWMVGLWNTQSWSPPAVSRSND